MSRAERLLQLMQVLRRHQAPVRGQVLAESLGISLRTLYRDIASLQAQGARIEGEPGLGYQLRPGFTLPPLMFTEEEIEALVLGLRWVSERADAQLAEAAREVSAKVATVIPQDLRRELEASSLLVGPRTSKPGGDEELALIRRAIRGERKLTITYRDLRGGDSTRIIWPFALGFFEHVRVVVAWCELRNGFRHFRTDRIQSLDVSEERYPRHRRALLEAWREAEGLPVKRTADGN
ncbi:MAG TPA: YafY family protein [Geothrix sp.]|nr:YafY family protein [Geothrix sp.]